MHRDYVRLYDKYTILLNGEAANERTDFLEKANVSLDDFRLVFIQILMLRQLYLVELVQILATLTSGPRWTATKP